MEISTTDLARVAAFSTLPEETLIVLQRVVVTRVFHPDEIVFAAGEPSGGLWFLREGRVRIFRTSVDGRKQEFCVMHAGMCCGCPLFFGDVNPAWAEAIDRVTFYFIERSAALQLAERHPDIGRLLFRVFGRGERVLAALVVGLSGSPVHARVARTILDHVDADPVAPSRVIAISHQELADSVGTSREVVTRSLDTLAREQIIALGRRGITVLDRRKLAHLTGRMCPLLPARP
ncbi:MAG: Crp/Fnr family transcriptional regulator [Acidobacteria bacterium]|nr:Crp/Fnr family transcriptional regulator [Acidobacteriota bacterium]